jgi:hypothetical protein
MEVNTRIQVEHRVSELCYALRFTNPDDTSDFVEVRSIVEAMVLSRDTARACLAPRACRVTAPRWSRASTPRIARSQPHAGGLIQSWTTPSSTRSATIRASA